MNPLANKIAAIPGARRCWRIFRYIKGTFDRDTRRNRLYDRCTAKIMSSVLREDANCVDVGCHAGEMLEQMLANAPRGNHYAFEPIPALAATLRRKFDQVKVFEVALSDQRGTATFRHVLSRPAYSGLRERKYPSENEQTELIEVRTERLDDLLPSDEPIHLIKVDVEGAELQVLRGAQRTIRTHKTMIVFEHGLGAAEFYGTRPEAVFDLLVDGCGLQISLLPAWLGGHAPLSREAFVAEFDNHTNFCFLAHP